MIFKSNPVKNDWRWLYFYDDEMKILRPSIRDVADLERQIPDSKVFMKNGMVVIKENETLGKLGDCHLDVAVQRSAPQTRSYVESF